MGGVRICEGISIVLKTCSEISTYLYANSIHVVVLWIKQYFLFDINEQEQFSKALFLPERHGKMLYKGRSLLYTKHFMYKALNQVLYINSTKQVALFPFQNEDIDSKKIK